MSSIRLKDVLDKWDKIEKGNPDQSFSIGFVSKDGSYRFLNRAVKTGTRFNLKDNEMRACLSIDDEGTANGHIIPFSIYRIVHFNGDNVIL